MKRKIDNHIFDREEDAKKFQFYIKYHEELVPGSNFFTIKYFADNSKQVVMNWFYKRPEHDMLLYLNYGVQVKLIKKRTNSKV